MKTENVQQLHNKQVILMRKPHSPHEVVFSPDPSDNHFFNVILRKVKTGELTASHYILSNDREQWQRLYEKQGFVTNDAHNDTSGES